MPSPDWRTIFGRRAGADGAIPGRARTGVRRHPLWVWPPATASEDALRAITRLGRPPDDPTMLELQAELDNSFTAEWRNFDQQFDRCAWGWCGGWIDRGYYRINSDLRMRTTLENTFRSSPFGWIATSLCRRGALPATVGSRLSLPAGRGRDAGLGVCGRAAGANEQAVVIRAKRCWRRCVEARWEERRLIYSNI